MSTPENIHQQYAGQKHTDEIQEIITRVPSWIVRWGIIIFSAILLMAISISAVVRYPDIIKAPVSFQSGNASPGKEFTGIIRIGQDNYAKVRQGQMVMIRLTVYPSDEYGTLNGVITHISDEPDQHGFFEVSIKLTGTTLQHGVTLKAWMTGQAEIITRDITVLQRITRNMKKT